MIMWQMAKKKVIVKKFTDKINAIGIIMKNWLNGTICEKMSFNNLNELIEVN